MFKTLKRKLVFEGGLGTHNYRSHSTVLYIFLCFNHHPNCNKGKKYIWIGMLPIIRKKIIANRKYGDGYQLESVKSFNIPHNTPLLNYG